MADAPEQQLHVLGAGVLSDGYGHIRDLAAAVNAGATWRANLARAATVDPHAIEGLDRIAQLAISAAHQAWTMADMIAFNPERVGLLYASAWGSIDSTQSYLDSMLDAQGRYASPRDFSRSVSSAGASALAIRLGIKGPCQTLAFDADPPRGRGAVSGALLQAWRLLATNRCDRVLLVWADQSAPIAEDLARRAACDLKKKEFRRYIDQGLGHGAAALIVALGPLAAPAVRLPLDASATPPQTCGKPYPTDAAVGLLEWLLKHSIVV